MKRPLCVSLFSNFHIFCASILKSNSQIMRTLLLLFFLLSSTALSAQSAYRGGAGDGYAMGETGNVFLSVKTPEQMLKLSVSPNPLKAGQALHLSRTGQQPEAMQLQVLDMAGRVIVQTDWSEGSTNKTLSLPQLQAGLYVLRLEGEGWQSFQKLVVE